MILLGILLGVVAAGLIARYNESNKLFWILFTSFVLGIASQSVYEIVTTTSKNCSKSIAQKNPTQSSHMPLALLNVVTKRTCKNPERKPNSVSQEHHSGHRDTLSTNDFSDKAIKPPTTFKTGCKENTFNTS